MRVSSIDLHTADNRMKAGLASHPTAIATFMRRLLNMRAACDVPAIDVFAIQLAGEEALITAIKHGNAMPRPKRAHEVRYNEQGNVVTLVRRRSGAS